MDERDGRQRLRIGIITLDPLRALGLEEVLSPGFSEGVPPAGPQGTPGLLMEVVRIDLAIQDGIDPGEKVRRADVIAGLDLLLLDASAIDHLEQWQMDFRTEHPQARLIVLGREKDAATIERVIGAGAKGYVSHAATEQELRQAIEVVADGSIWAPRKVMARLLAAHLAGVRPVPTASQTQDGRRSGSVSPALTPREVDVLDLLLRGLPNREIALSLGVDEGTVKAHVGRLMRKAGVDNRTALTMQALGQRVSERSAGLLK